MNKLQPDQRTNSTIEIEIDPWNTSEVKWNNEKEVNKIHGQASINFAFICGLHRLAIWRIKFFGTFGSHTYTANEAVATV